MLRSVTCASATSEAVRPAVRTQMERSVANDSCAWTERYCIRVLESGAALQ